jgi:hypothetical protein
MRVTTVAALLGPALVLTLASSNAHAETRRFHAVASCTPAPAGYNGGAYNGTPGINSALQYTNVATSTNRGALIICPLIVDDSALPFHVGTSVSVNGWSDGANELYMQICYQAANGNNPVCGAGANSTGVGVATLTAAVPFSPSIPAGAYPYVQVTIGGINSGVTFWGYTVSN